MCSWKLPASLHGRPEMESLSGGTLCTSYFVLRTSMIGGSADRHSLTLSIASRTRVLKHVQRVGFKWARDRGVCSPVRSTENGERRTENGMMRSQWLLVQTSWGCINEHNSQALEMFGESLREVLAEGFRCCLSYSDSRAYTYHLNCMLCQFDALVSCSDRKFEFRVCWGPFIPRWH